MKVQNILLIVLLCGLNLCSGYRILAIFTFNGRSHYGVLDAITKELALRGHQVDVMSNFPITESIPNYTNIEIPRAKSNGKLEYSDVSSAGRQGTIEWLRKEKVRQCNLLGHSKISNLIKNPPTDPPYDLLLLHYVIGYQCLPAIGHIWNIPVVGITTTTLYSPMQHFVGNPLNLAISSGHVDYYQEKLNFWDRVYNVIRTHRDIYRHYQHFSVQDKYIKKYLGPNMPSFWELEKTVSMILSNSHYTYHGVKPKTPAVIEIGGINIKNDTSELDPTLKKFLDQSKDGFMYFSFGSLMVIESLPINVLEKFYEAIRKISPIRVVMKISNPSAMPKSMPDNVFTYSWLPQQQILQHPNIKGFVTHGGGLSTQEALYQNVPMICVPFFAEQYVNCDILSIKNVSIKINVKVAQQSDYDYAFQQILSNSMYKESIRKFSTLYWDRPQSPKDTAVYWIEYVIRHGKNVLRSSAVDLDWWQYELLDVYAFLLACAVTIVCVTIFTAYLIIKSFFRELKLNSSKKLN